MKKDDLKTVFNEIEYGTIVVKVGKIMKERDISRYRLNKNANIRFQTIQALEDNSACRIDFGVLAKLCYVLDCKVGDILEYVPDEDSGDSSARAS